MAEANNSSRFVDLWRTIAVGLAGVVLTMIGSWLTRERPLSKEEVAVIVAHEIQDLKENVAELKEMYARMEEREKARVELERLTEVRVKRGNGD